MAKQTQSSISTILGKTADEAYVEYYLFPEDAIGNDSAALKELLVEVSVKALSISGDYLWHKEPFQLMLDTTRENGQGGFLHGCVHYEINIEDEWFIVHIIQVLTRFFPGLIARVIDQDGEFLLIEAAEHLPDWAESDEACQQRVYIANGNVHLVGEIKREDGETVGNLNLESPIPVHSAVNLVRRYPGKTLASTIIQRTIEMRVGKYPQKFLHNCHHVSVMVPPRVAFLLKSKPTLVSEVVRAFHDKDPIDMKAVRLMPTFSPIDDLVKTRVRFTKTLYSMLSADDYYPDVKVKWKLPLPKSPEFKSHSLGAKLTLGFEILVNYGKQNQIGDDFNYLESSPNWCRYRDKLIECGYYRDLIEGSKTWNLLQEQAKSYFLASVQNELTPTNKDRVVWELMSMLSQPLDQSTIITQEVDLPDDDDSWMEFDAANLESLLADQFKTKISDQKLDQIPEKLKEFMSQMSDFAGVEVPGSDIDEEDGDGDLDPLDFRANDFVSAMDKLLSELGKPSHDFDLSEPSSEEDEEEVSVKIKDLEKKYGIGDTSSGDFNMKTLMSAMDAELEKTEVGKTFQTVSGRGDLGNSATRPKVKVKRRSKGTPTSTSTESYVPVDIDLNALTNILESFEAQENAAGPSANLLRNVGFDISKAAKK